MKNAIINNLVIIAFAICTVFTSNTFASEREITFTNNTGQAVDDLHIEFTKKETEWDDSKPHTFNSVRHDAGKNNHNFYGTSIAAGGSATMTFKIASGDITINRWWWTSGGNAVADGERVGGVRQDNNTNNLAWNGPPATGNGDLLISCMGINAMFETTPGFTPQMTANSFVNFIQTNFNFGGVKRIYINPVSPTQICIAGNMLGNPPLELQIQPIAPDNSQQLALMHSSGRMLVLNAAIEGLYNPAMNKETMDYSTVMLRRMVPPYDVVEFTGTSLDTNGNGRFFFFNAQNSVPYYIVVNHRNGIETWSATGTNQFVNNNMNYMFSDAPGKAYGGNQKHIGPKFCIYTGDVDKNGVVDAGDLSILDNDCSNFATGYIQSDLNRDHVTDATDYALADNNAGNFVTMIRP